MARFVFSGEKVIEIGAEVPLEKTVVRIVLRGVPPSLNRFAGRTNSWEYRQCKDEWTRAVQATVLARKAKPPRPFQRSAVRICYHFNDRRRHDPDNYAGKFLLDGLTRAGVIADDDFAHIRLVLDGIYDPDGPATEITVEEEE